MASFGSFQCEKLKKALGVLGNGHRKILLFLQNLVVLQQELLEVRNAELTRSRIT